MEEDQLWQQVSAWGWAWAISYLHLHLQFTLTTTCTSSLLPPPSPSFARATPVRLSATLACSAGLAPSFLLTPAMHIHLSAGVPQQGVPTFASASPPCTFHTSTYTSYLRPASRPLASALASLTLPRAYTHIPPPHVLGTVTSDPHAHSTRRTHLWRLRRRPVHGLCCRCRPLSATISSPCHHPHRRA